MNILMSGLAFDRGRSGVSVYILSVLRELLKKHRVTLVIQPRDWNHFSPHPRLTLKEIPSQINTPLKEMLWHTVAFPLIYRKKEFDLLFLPAGNRRLMIHYPLFTIATIHDLSQFHIDQKYDLKRMIYIKKIIPRLLKRVDRIVAVSKQTEQDLIKYYKIAPEKMTQLYNGYNKICSDVTTGEKKHILYVSRVEHPGKNHLNLIHGYEQLPEKIKKKYPLICAGGLMERSSEVIDYCNSSRDRKQIILTGFVDQNRLSELYRDAVLFVFPSCYEGFGLPLIEAMGCGIPVICSNRGALKEIGDGVALMFDPDRPEQISRLMKRVLTDDELQKEMIEKGLERVKQFSWEEHVAGIISIYRGAT